jgi:hypothetical protein
MFNDLGLESRALKDVIGKTLKQVSVSGWLI